MLRRLSDEVCSHPNPTGSQKLSRFDGKGRKDGGLDAEGWTRIRRMFHLSESTKLQLLSKENVVRYVVDHAATQGRTLEQVE